MAETWANWSGSLRFRPRKIETPENEASLADLVRRAADEKRTVRVVGAGHSSSPLVETDDLLVSLKHFQGVVSHNAEACEATIGAGMTVHDAGEALFEIGLATHNTGDVDVQLIAGAIGTGTHGTGKRLGNLSTMLAGVRMVTADGEIVERSIDRDPEFIRAARVALGTLGIYTQLKLRLLPVFQLHRKELCAQIDTCLAHLDELIAENRNFDFYWYPRSDMAKIRTLNPPGEGPGDLPYAECVDEKRGWSAEVLPRTRELEFDEMEYALPAEAGAKCFQEIRRLVKEKHRRSVGWRVLYRTVAADDAYLSPPFERETVTISLHHNAGLPFDEYFNDIEPIFRAYGGRPHWGKKHSLKADELRPLYPMWDRFLETRRRSDPEGRFLNPYLRDLLGVER